MVGEELFQCCTASSVGLRGQVGARLELVQGDEVGRQLIGRSGGGCSAAVCTLLKTFEGRPVALPHHQFSVERGVVGQL